MKKNLAITLSLLTLLFTSGAYAGGLPPAEESYHDKIFDYVMDNIEAEKSYDWASYSGKGTIKVGQPFISKSRSNCRPFVEAFNVQGDVGESKGVACRRTSGDGWCRLKTTDMLSCALEHPGFTLGTGAYTVSAPSVDMPDISTGGIGGGGGSGSVNVTINGPNITVPRMSGLPSIGGGGGGSNGQTKSGNTSDKSSGGSASGAAYAVTDTLGEGAAKSTGFALDTFKSLFR